MKNACIHCRLSNMMAMLCLLSLTQVLVAQTDATQDIADAEEAISPETEIAAGVESSMDEQAKTRIPEWFDLKNEYVPETKMAFVRSKESFLAKDDARVSLELQARKLAKRIVQEQLNIQDAESLGLNGKYIIEQFVHEQRFAFVEDLECIREATMEEDVPFWLCFAQLRFDERFDDYVQKRVAECRTQERLIKSGLFGATILGLLVVAFGYFKMENATRGFYSRRLQTGSLVLAAAVILVAYLVGQRVIQ